MANAPRRPFWPALSVLLAVVAAGAWLASGESAQGQVMDPAASMYGSQNNGGYGPSNGGSGMGRGPMRPPKKKEKPRDGQADEMNFPANNEPMMPGDIAVAEVRIVGNDTLKKEKILPYIRTRANRPYRMAMLESDVRRLYKSGLFVSVEPLLQDTAQGRVVIFKVVERPRLKYVRFVGNQKIKEKSLVKECGLKVGDAADPFAVDEARRSLEEYYHEKGYANARVFVKEGNQTGDRGAIFVIDEGVKQKIAWTDFIGNTIASDERLRTQIEAKQGILWIFKGEFDRKTLESDKEALTVYYHSLGFFNVRVGAEVSFLDRNKTWARITYVIDEGPRWKVRDVSFIGSTKFAVSELQELVKMQKGEYFNQNAMNTDIRKIREKFGNIGHVFADIKAEPRFLEEPGELDLVYKIGEGDRYRVGRINPQILGESPHTKITVLLNSLSLQPGDILTFREVRDSERRIQFSQVFNTNPQMGKMPKIAFSPNDAKPIEADPTEQIARPPSPPGGSIRGQSAEGLLDSSLRRIFDITPLSERFRSNMHDAWPYPQDGGSR